MIPQETQDRLNDIAARYAQQIYDSTRKELIRIGRSMTLANDLTVKWLKASDKYPPRILVIFRDYGNVLEVRKPLWTGMPPVQRIVEWVGHVMKSSNSRHFTHVPGYKNGAPNLPEFKKMQRIAYAVAMDKRINDTWRGKPWRKRTLSQEYQPPSAE